MSQKKSEPEQSAATRSQALAAIGRPIAAGTLAVQAWTEMGAEMVRFLQDRVQQDIKAQQAMLTCATLEEMQLIQARYFIAAQEQYAAEAAKMLDLMGRAAASGLTASTPRRYDDVPL